MKAFLILVALYLPGHFLGGALVRKGDGWAELAFLRVACCVAVSTPILVALALLGWFETPIILVVLVVCAAVASFFSEKSRTVQNPVKSVVIALRESRKTRLPTPDSRPPGAQRPRWWDPVVLGLVFGGLVLYAHPAEYVLKDRDPGVYTVVAAKLARTGELLTRDPLVSAVASFHEFEQGVKHTGFYIYDKDIIVPQFFPGPFVWLGLGDLVGGVWGSLYVAPVFGALSVGAAFLLGRELFGRWAGFVGAALLAVGYAQVWWSRYPSSEVMTQFFVLAGLWSAARFVRDGERRTGALAGALLGGAMLIRVDAFLAALAVPVLVGCERFLGRSVRRWVPVCVPLLLLGGAALLYASTIGERYLALIYELHLPDQALRIVPYLLAAALVAAMALWVLRRRWGGGLRRQLALRGRGLSLLAALVLLGLALWAYFVWPEPWEGLPGYWGGATDRMANFHAYDRQVLVRMVWFVTPAVAVLGMVGFALAAYRIDRARALFLGAFLAFGLLYAALPNVAPDLPWATRRFVPVVFPGLCLLAGFAVVEAGRALTGVWGARTGTACAAALAVLPLAWSVYVAWPVYGVRELQGAVESFERFEEAIPEARVVYVEPPGEDYAATLDYLYGRPVLVYDRERFRRELPYLREAGLLEDAVYVTGEERAPPYFPGLEALEVGGGEVSFARLEDGFEGVPRDTYEERQGFRVYKLERR